MTGQWAIQPTSSARSGSWLTMLERFKLISKIKSVDRMDGTVYLTNVRLIYLDSAQPQRQSGQINLNRIQSTTYYAGFLSSSPKVTLTLKPQDTDTKPGSVAFPIGNLGGPLSSWVCSVCGMSNQSSNLTCSLCGITTTTTNKSNPNSLDSPSPSPSPSSRPISPDLPLSSARPCRACTYLNHPDLDACEVCGTILSSNPPSTTQTRDPSPSPGTNGPDFVKLSFRKSGDKAFYNHLRAALKLVSKPSKAQARTGIGKPKG